jgi:hypothetical protein
MLQRTEVQRYEVAASDRLLPGILTDPTIMTAMVTACINQRVSPASRVRKVATVARSRVPKNIFSAANASLPTATFPVTIMVIPRSGNKQTSKPTTIDSNEAILGILSDVFSMIDFTPQEPLIYGRNHSPLKGQFRHSSIHDNRTTRYATQEKCSVYRSRKN